MYYTGRDMKTTHQGINISINDWQKFLFHVNATIEALGLKVEESSQVIAFINSLEEKIVEART